MYLTYKMLRILSFYKQQIVSSLKIIELKMSVTAIEHRLQSSYGLVVGESRIQSMKIQFRNTAYIM